jgi:hypothetical protein
MSGGSSAALEIGTVHLLKEAISIGRCSMRFKRRFALYAAVLAGVGVSSVALAAGGLVGTYTTTITKPSDLKGKWTLAFAKGHSYTVALNSKAVARGRYSATATTITFVRETGSGCTGTGTYVWKKAGTTMTFIRKREAPSCHGRAAVLAHRFTQVR